LHCNAVLYAPFVFLEHTPKCMPLYIRRKPQRKLVEYSRVAKLQTKIRRYSKGKKEKEKAKKKLYKANNIQN
jgi:predicted GIY-YIG superfamily endonuclease